tara:strand:- start:1112 stop:1657 length:546 start_codon:yes stop_codon:yes gene_type:complete
MTIEVSCSACGKVLRAKDSAAGKKAKCPDCGAVISIPEAVFDAVDADEFGSGFDDELDFAAVEQYSPAASSGGSGSKRRPCPACGEMIVSGAAKCRFCGEIFDRKLKQQSARSTPSDEDSNLSAGEWLICIFCSGIGCIVGIVYMCQSKPKGIKMLGISLLVQVIFTVIRVVAELALQNNF